MKVTADAKSWVLLVIALALPNISWAQQDDLDKIPLHPPAPTCHTLQLQSQDGTPIRHAPVRLSVEEQKFRTPHLSSITIEFKPLRKLKTDAEGRIRLQKLKPHSYFFELINTAKKTFGQFYISDDWQPGECTQVLVAKDEGDYVSFKPVETEEPAKK